METTTEQTDAPRIYVACLASCEEGILHGAWIDAAREPWEIWADISMILAASPTVGAEGWTVHDHAGFGAVRIAKTEGVQAISALAIFIVTHGELGAALVQYFGGDLWEAQEAMKDGYAGRYASLADYLECSGGRIAMAVPDRVRCYTDWQAIADEGEAFGDLFAIPADEGTVHVFVAR